MFKIILRKERPIYRYYKKKANFEGWFKRWSESADCVVEGYIRELGLWRLVGISRPAYVLTNTEFINNDS
jgi:hypothetical protein